MTRHHPGFGRRTALAVPVLVSLLLSAGSGGVAAAAPGAAPGAADPKRPAFSLSVSPTRMIVAPEDTDQDQKFVVTNSGTEPLELEVKRAGFTANRDGALTLVKEKTEFSAVDWLTVSPVRFQLAPGARQTVLSHIAMPTHPEPGDHHVALLFTVPAAKDGSGVRLNRGIAAPLYITAPGRIDDSVRAIGLHTPSFALRGPIDLTAAFTSTGTVHRDFRGPGGVLKAHVDGREVAFPDFTVGRGADREVTARWADPPLMCLCRVTVTVPGAAGKPQEMTATILVFPVHLAVAALAALAALAGLGLLVRRRYRARVRAAARALREREDALAGAVPRPRSGAHDADTGTDIGSGVNVGSPPAAREDS
ncbi:fimbrial biogenesis chaperone [Parafrankia discariae]|uniref:hypothetical protein n=1 Tax=Parafrankia discariae TaxID=365528 RepID=UPI0012B69B52|nr:hypothetical protein [Parafrankia discariae]